MTEYSQAISKMIEAAQQHEKISREQDYKVGEDWSDTCEDSWLKLLESFNRVRGLAGADEIPVTRKMGIKAKDMTPEQRNEYVRRSEDRSSRLRRNWERKFPEEARRIASSISRRAPKDSGLDEVLESETQIIDIDFSNRTYNCLVRYGIRTLGELATYFKEELLAIRNLGQSSVEEIESKLTKASLGLREEVG